MKTKFWILLFLAIAVVCAGLSVWLLGGRAETTVEVYSDGKLVQTIDLAVDGEYRIDRLRREDRRHIGLLSHAGLRASRRGGPRRAHRLPAEPARRAVQHAV